MEFNIIVKHNQKIAMCFLKTLPELSQLSTHPTLPGKDQNQPSQQTPFSFDQNPCGSIQLDTMLPWLCSQQLVSNSMALLKSNQDLMHAAQQSLHRTETLISQLENTCSQFLDSSDDSEKKTMPTITECSEEVDCPQHESSNNLTKKLFGARSYAYQLQSAQVFPRLLYKERNFGLGVKLVEQNSGKIKQNANVVSLCMGVCDNQGNWIHETKDGSGFLKGKAECELFNGESSFLKMALRDVSRTFFGRTLNLVIYAKPSVLRYSEESPETHRVDPEQIEPLIIEGIVVKAKKRE